MCVFKKDMCVEMCVEELRSEVQLFEKSLPIGHGSAHLCPSTLEVGAGKIPSSRSKVRLSYLVDLFIYK